MTVHFSQTDYSTRFLNSLLDYALKPSGSSSLASRQSPVSWTLGSPVYGAPGRPPHRKPTGYQWSSRCVRRFASASRQDGIWGSAFPI